MFLSLPGGQQRALGARAQGCCLGSERLRTSPHSLPVQVLGFPALPFRGLGYKLTGSNRAQALACWVFSPKHLTPPWQILFLWKRSSVRVSFSNAQTCFSFVESDTSEILAFAGPLGGFLPLCRSPWVQSGASPPVLFRFERGCTNLELGWGGGL